MPNISGYTYVVIIVVVAALGMGYGLWSSNNTSLKKSKEQIVGTDDTEVRLKIIKTNLELDIKHLQEDYVDLVTKIESARMKLNKVTHPEDQRSSKGLKHHSSGLCKVQIAHEPPHSGLPGVSGMDEELKLDHSEFFENALDLPGGHLEPGVGVTVDVELEQVNHQIEVNGGLDLIEDAQDGSFFSERKQPLLDDSTRLENQLTENKVRQTELIQENKECENRKGLLSKEIRELEVLKKNLEEEVRQMKAQRRGLRSASRRKESRKEGSIDVEMGRCHRGASLRERLKNMHSSYHPGHSQSLRVMKDPEKESSLVRRSDLNILIISDDDISCSETIDQPDTEVGLTFSEQHRTQSQPDTGGEPDAGSDWNLSTIFLT